MDVRAQQRTQLVPALARAMRTRDFRTTLAQVSVTDSSAHRVTVIPVLPDDPMSYVFDRVRESNCIGAVAMQAGEGFALALVSPDDAPNPALAADDDRLTAIHADSPVSMFFALLVATGSPLVIEQVAARLVPGGDMQFA